METIQSPLGPFVVGPAAAPAGSQEVPGTAPTRTGVSDSLPPIGAPFIRKILSFQAGFRQLQKGSRLKARGRARPFALGGWKVPPKQRPSILKATHRQYKWGEIIRAFHIKVCYVYIPM